MTLDELWNRPVPRWQGCTAERLAALPEPARRYLAHALPPGAQSAAVRLRMHGEIKLQRWQPFTAEEVIHRECGLHWQARVRIFGLPVHGHDRCVDGVGEMRWRLLGLIPLVHASGSDITRSAAGRMAAELVWLPAALCQPDIAWSRTAASTATARFALQGEAIELHLRVSSEGAIEAVHLLRWGNPDGRGYRALDFGAHVEAERSFDGYTIPSQLRVGWYFGAERFDAEGEFFRVRVDDATYRPIRLQTRQEPGV